MGLFLAVRDAGRFEAMILEGAVVPGVQMPSVDTELQRARDIARTQGMPEAIRRWFGFAPWFDVMRHHPEECRAGEHWSIISDFAGAPWIFDGEARSVAPIEESLPKLNIPILLYNGEHDIQDFLEAAAGLEARLPQARREVISGGDGFPAWEFTVIANTLVAAFLADTCGDGA